jgi:hypothetical protein
MHVQTPKDIPLNPKDPNDSEMEYEHRIEILKSEKGHIRAIRI